MPAKSIMPALVGALGIAIASSAQAETKQQQQAKDRDQNKHEKSSSHSARHGTTKIIDSPVSTLYRRLAPAWYADGISQPVEGPNARFISNRIFADNGQNLFSETGVTQWAWTWGQFVDHTIGLREQGDEPIDVVLDSTDPLEKFTNAGNSLTLTRSKAAENTGVDTPREQVNVISSRFDASAVYGSDKNRLEWLRVGPVDNNLKNNSARLLLPNNWLPTKNARNNASEAPDMEKNGMLFATTDPDSVQVVAGDVRANENIALTSIQTLFAREHNRIVDKLPINWSESKRFSAARMLVSATQQYITYNEFLPSLGLYLNDAEFDAQVDPRVTQEFAVVGYRAHSMVHGEIEIAVAPGTYSDTTLNELQAQGIPVDIHDDIVEIAVPLNIAHGNPDLVRVLGAGHIAIALSAEPQYKNDEQIDNQLRSVLFQIPTRNSSDGENCLDGALLPECYQLINDLGVLDIMRGRDHGIAPYNVLRETYGLSVAGSFTDITGEASDAFPTDNSIDITDPVNDPNILDFVSLRDTAGQQLEFGSEEADGEAVAGVRRSTLAARLKAIYHDINQVDAFVGMVSEPHVPGSDLGELQHAIWKKQFEDLRDADPDFYLWNSDLSDLVRELKPLALDYQQTLADIIRNNTSLSEALVPENVFIAND